MYCTTVIPLSFCSVPYSFSLVFGSSEVKWSELNSLSHVRLFETPWTVAHQALPSMGFSRQKYWSGLPFPSPGELPNPGIEPRSPTLQADVLPSEPLGSQLNNNSVASWQEVKWKAWGKERILQNHFPNGVRRKFKRSLFRCYLSWWGYDLAEWI